MIGKCNKIMKMINDVAVEDNDEDHNSINY